MKADTLFYFLLALTLTAFMATEAGNAAAETRYVSDVMVITLRTEPYEDAEKIRMLRSDTPLEVIETQGEYLKVKTGDNEEGWVIGRYLTSAIPKSRVIAELGERINRLEEKNEALEKIRKDLEEELN
jgi:SH3 domain protein